MHFEAPSLADAPAISALIHALSEPFFVSPSREGAESFLASIGVEGVVRCLASERFRYLVARSDGTLAGVIAIRDGAHLFHLFVAPAYQGQGLARQLWHQAKAQALAAGNPGRFTVNASLNAVPSTKPSALSVRGRFSG